MVSASADPFATLYALGSAGLTSMSPRTIPSTGLPPNTRKADHATRAGKKAKAVSVNI
ncbi:hypothetical protein D3C72_948890 [compost metagenome]